MSFGRRLAHHPGIRIGLVSAALASWLLPGVADAAVLRSGQIFVAGTGAAVFCFVSNVATKPVAIVGTRLIDTNGSDVATTSHCLVPSPSLEPGASCEFEGSDAIATIPVRVELEVKGSAKSVRARCVGVANGVVEDSVELR